MLLQHRIWLLLPFITLFASSQLKPSALPPNWRPQMEEKAREESAVIAARKTVLACTPLKAAIFDYLTYKDLLRLQSTHRSFDAAVQVVAMKSDTPVMDPETGQMYIPLIRWLKSLPPEKVTKELAKALTHQLEPWDPTDCVFPMVGLWQFLRKEELPAASMLTYILGDKGFDHLLPTLPTFNNVKLHGLSDATKKKSLQLEAIEDSSQEYLHYVRAVYEAHRILPTLTHMYGRQACIMSTQEIFYRLPRLYLAINDQLNNFSADEAVFEAKRLLHKLIRMYGENVSYATRELAETVHQKCRALRLDSFDACLAMFNVGPSPDPDNFFYRSDHVNQNIRVLVQLCDQALRLKKACRTVFEPPPIEQIIGRLVELDNTVNELKSEPLSLIRKDKIVIACRQVASLIGDVCKAPGLSKEFRIKVLHEIQDHLGPLLAQEKDVDGRNILQDPDRRPAFLLQRTKVWLQFFKGAPFRDVAHLQLSEMKDLLSALKIEEGEYYSNYDAHQAAVRAKVDAIGMRMRHFKSLMANTDQLSKDERIELLETMRWDVLMPLEKFQSDWPTGDRYSALVLVTAPQQEIRNQIVPAKAKEEEKEKPQG